MNNSLIYKAIAMGFAVLAPSSLLLAQGEAAPASNEEFLYSILVAFGLLFIAIFLVLNSVIKSLARNKELWKPKNPNNNTGAAIAAFLVFSSGSLFAVNPDAPVVGVFGQYSSSFWMLVMFDLFLAVVIIAQLAIFRKLIESLREKEAPVAAELAEEQVVQPKENKWMKKIMKMMTRTVPVEREEEVMTDHEYDGIRELDNVLPPWWVAMFYASIVFAVIYLVHYHVLRTGDLQIAEYRADVEEANAEVAAYMAMAKAQVDETSVTVIADANRLSKGEDIYTTHCVTCHGVQGEGGVGPNFTDNYWIHGGSIKDLFTIIKYGVPSKGMISWRAQLTPTQMQDVASYILTFQGTNPPNQKEPQGELYEPEVAEPPEEIGDQAQLMPADSIEAKADSLETEQ